MKHFARNVLLEEMKPPVSPSTRGAMPDKFVQYLKQYYAGSYIDRYGNSIIKPQLSLTVSDEEIAGAISLLVDYIIDSIDATPVWGSDPLNNVGTSTTFYPGTGMEPTFLTVFGVSDDTYQTIAAGPCGITKDKAQLLGTLAGAASDAGGTVSGLVHGTFGGFSLGLGFLGKFSFGDDQTLAAIVKAAASRLSSRATVASAWPILAQIKYTNDTPSALGVPTK